MKLVLSFLIILVASSTIVESNFVEKFFQFGEKLGHIGEDVIEGAKSLVKAVEGDVLKIFDKVLDIIDLVKEAGDKFAIIWEDIRDLIDISEYDSDTKYGLETNQNKTVEMKSLKQLIKQNANTLVSNTS